MVPWLTTVANVQVTLQTDVVKDIPCGTSGSIPSRNESCLRIFKFFNVFRGSVIYFDKVEVVNLLSKRHAHETVKLYGENYDKTWIFDRIHHEISE